MSENNNNKVLSENTKMEQLTADINTFKESVDASKSLDSLIGQAESGKTISIEVMASHPKVLTLVEEMARVTLIDPPPVAYEKVIAEADQLQKSGLNFQIAYHELLMLTVTLLGLLGGSATIYDMDCLDLFPEINVTYPNEESAVAFTETRQEIATPFRRYSWDGMQEYE